MTCRRNPATMVPTGKGNNPLKRGRGGRRTVRGECDGAHEERSASARRIRDPAPRADRPKGRAGSGQRRAKAERPEADRTGKRPPARRQRPASADAPRSPIAGGAVAPKGETTFARSSSEGRTPRARPVERHRGDHAGRKASRHMVSARTQQDREPWMARGGGSARLGCAVGAKNLERAVEHDTARVENRTRRAERQTRAREETRDWRCGDAWVRLWSGVKA